jgi:hypothetical protein
MSHLDILLPFSLPPPEMAPDLLRALNTPAFSTLIARAKPHRRETLDAFSRALPHETWLARQFGLEIRLQASGSPPVAPAMMQALDLTPDAGVWFVLHPVHLHIARDHLVLTNQRQLALSEQESRDLFDAAKPLFDEAGKPLLYGDARTWFVRADAWNDLRTATPDAASGHNIDIWMPQGAGERDWRKLQNEVQMHWHAHRVNAERESRNLKPVNSIWLWGGAPTAMIVAPSRYKEAFNLPGWMNALGQFATRTAHGSTASDVITMQPERGLLVIDTLIEPGLDGDWSTWLERFHALETDWFEPLSAALKAGKIDQLSFIMTHSTDLSEMTAGKQSLRKFWIKPSLARLAP